MRKLVRKFDVVAGRVIGRLPAGWFGWVSLLCVIVSPFGWAIVMVLGAGLAWQQSMHSLVWLSIYALAALPLTEFIKLLVRRPRPISIYTETMRIRSYSFPSSHAYGASLGGGYVVIFLSQFMGGIGLYVAGVVVALLAVIVAVARVYLKAHFPSDVAAGLLAGVAVTILLTLGVLA